MFFYHSFFPQPSTSFIPASCFPITQACYLGAREAFFISLPKYSIHKRLSPISNKTYSARRGHERAAGQFILIYWKHYGIAQRPWSESSCAQSCSSLSAAVQSRKIDEVALDKMRSSPPRTTIFTVGI